MDKKYKLTDESIVIDGITLYRIEALRAFGRVKKGEKGGFVESEENLSHSGNCWIFNEACVYNNAHISENAKIFDAVQISKNATISGHVVITHYAIITDYAVIRGFVEVHNFAKIAKHAVISDYAKIEQEAIINGDDNISGYALIRNKGHETRKSYVTVGPVGSNRYVTYEKESKIVNADCFTGTIDEFEKKVKEKYEKSDYYEVIAYFRIIEKQQN
jgi:carbonic anhydrase/acetyltransferase-like protein (isoleucine patch superfamily)